MRLVKCIASVPGIRENSVIDLDPRLTVISARDGETARALARAVIGSIWKDTHPSCRGDEAAYLELFLSLDDLGFYRIINSCGNFYKILHIIDGHERTLFLDKIAGSADENRTVFRLRDGIADGAYKTFLSQVDFDILMHSSFIAPTDAWAYDLKPEIIRSIILTDRSHFIETSINLKKIFAGPADESRLPEISRRRDRLRALGKEIQIMSIRDTRKKKLFRERNTVQKEIDTLSNSSNSLISQKDLLMRMLENLTKVDDLKKDFERLKDEVQREQDKVRTISRLEKELERLFPQFSDVDIEDLSRLDDIQTVFNDIRNLNVNIDRYHVNHHIRRRRVRVISVVVNTVIAALGVLYSIRGAALSLTPLTVAGAFGGALIGLNLAVVLYWLVSSDKKELEKLKQEQVALKDRCKALLENNALDVDDYMVTEIYEFLLKYFEDFIDYTERKKDLNRMTSSLKEGDYISSIRNKLDTLKREEEHLRDELNVGIDTLNIVEDMDQETDRIADLIQNVEREISFTREKIETKQGILRQIDSEISQEINSMDRMEQLIREKNSVDLLLDRWKINQTTMGFLVDCLDAAVEQTARKRLGTIAAAARDHWARLSGEDDGSPHDDEAIRALLVDPTGIDAPVGARRYGMELALKAAMTDFLDDAGISMPLILDDPFSTIEWEWTGRLRELLTGIVRRRQVIIFTGQRGLIDWGTVIEL